MGKDTILDELSKCSTESNVGCMAAQIGTQVGADVAMKQISKFALNRILRQQMETNTLKYSEEVAGKMAEKYGAEWTSRLAEKEVGSMALQLEVGADFGPIGMGIDMLMAAGMLMDMADPEGYLQAQRDPQIEMQVGKMLQNLSQEQQNSLTTMVKKSTDPVQKACWQSQADQHVMNTHPISGGIVVADNVNVTNDSAINLNDPVVQRKIKHYMLDYLAYTSKGTAEAPPLKNDGSPDEANWVPRSMNSKGECLNPDYLKGNPAISNKYRRTKNELDFEDGYAKKMYQMGEKYQNDNIKTIGLHMQNYPSLWINGLTITISLLLWGVLRLVFSQHLSTVNALSGVGLVVGLVVGNL